MSGSDAYPEPGKIRQMFDDISGKYDRLNDLMTAGLHHRWREMGVMLAGVGPGDSALDVCCGTGDFAFALRRAVGPTGRVVGVDVSEEMLKLAREKCGFNQLYVEFRSADALDLPFPDGDAPGREGAPDGAAEARSAEWMRGTVSAAAPAAAPATAPPPGARHGFDACTVGFGIRNVVDIAKAFSEMRRVCRPGAKVVCLEITQPQIPVFKQFYVIWLDHDVPWLWKFAAGDESANRYLPASVRRLPDPEELRDVMRDVGLRNPRYEILAGGVIALHHAVV